MSKYRRREANSIEFLVLDTLWGLFVEMDSLDNQHFVSIVYVPFMYVEMSLVFV